MKKWSYNTSRSGFNLIEMIIVITVLGIISMVAVPIFMSGFNAFFWARDVADVTSQEELAVDRMVREIRTVDPSTDFDSAALPNATEIKFAFPKHDGSSSTEWVIYALQGTNLMRNTDVLAATVSSLAFSYTKQDGTTLTPPLSLTQAKSIWLVNVLLQISGRKISQSLGTTVFLRKGPITRP